jgi:hypothetical protein
MTQYDPEIRVRLQGNVMILKFCTELKVHDLILNSAKYYEGTRCNYDISLCIAYENTV